MADRNMMLTVDEYMAIRRLIESERESEGASLVMDSAPPKKRKRVSKYGREFGRQMKRLKIEKPRTPVTRLMKQAHSRTRKAMKKR